MMGYEMFKALVADSFLDYMPQAFQDHSVKISPVNKANQKLDGMELAPPGDRDTGVVPMVFVNHMYEDYLKGEDFKEVMEQYAESIQDIYRNMPDAVSGPLFSNAEEKIVMALINTQQNSELLEGVPHREFLDLSIVYRLVTGIEGGVVYSALLNNAHAEQLGMDEEQMYGAARENTRRILPPVVKNMDDVICGIFMPEGMPEELAGQMAGEIMPSGSLYVVTNSCTVNGAVSMLYEDKLHEIAESIGDDLYILPSSIHEVIAVPASMGKPEELAEMVADINMEQVALAERLSNQVYHYDKDLRKLELATDTPNKRLDGIAEEPAVAYGKGQAR